MRRSIWRLDPDAAMELIEAYPGGVEAFIQRAFHASSFEEAVVKQIKTEEQLRRMIQLLQQKSKDQEWNGGERKK